MLLRVGAILAAAPLVATGLFFGWWSLVVLSKLFADYEDSAPATYVIVGGALMGIALSGFFSAAVLVWAAFLRIRGRSLLR